MTTDQAKAELLLIAKNGELDRSDLPQDFRNADLAGVDLSGMDLSGLDFSGANLSDANLAEANLNNTKFFKADLSRAVLMRAQLENADLTGANLTDTNMEEVRATRIGLGSARLNGTKFFNANLDHATFSKAEVTGTCFRRATLRSARMREGSFINSDFSEVNLNSADITMSDVSGSNFYNAELQNTRLRLITGFEDANWIGVDVRNINLSGAYRVRRFIADQNYLKEFKSAGRMQSIIYYIWLVTSDCGRSIGRWCALIVAITLGFGWMYSMVEMDFGSYPTLLSPFYFSVVTLTSLGFGDVVPTSIAGQLLAMLEVFFGYIMLGGLLALFTNKIARRAD